MKPTPAVSALLGLWLLVAPAVTTSAQTEPVPTAPSSSVALLDAVTFDEVADIARRVDPDKLAVACVGPHAADEF